MLKWKWNKGLKWFGHYDITDFVLSREILFIRVVTSIINGKGTNGNIDTEFVDNNSKSKIKDVNVIKNLERVLNVTSQIYKTTSNIFNLKKKKEKIVVI